MSLDQARQAQFEGLELARRVVELELEVAELRALVVSLMQDLQAVKKRLKVPVSSSSEEVTPKVTGVAEAKGSSHVEDAFDC